MIHEKLPFVTIVIPTFNREHLLQQCLDAVFKLDYPQDKYKVIVVDDGSDDETLGLMLRHKFFCGHHQYVRLDRNQGAAMARNAGIHLAEGDFIAFLDDDCLVDMDWLRLTIEAFELFHPVAAVGGGILNAQDDSVGWASYILEFSTWFPVGQARLICNMSTCNIVYRRCDIAGMSFGCLGKDAGYEDSIFNDQLRNRGKSLLFDPRIKVRHCRAEDRWYKGGFLASQRRYALGFIRGGYVIHGVWGKLLFNVPVLNLFCFRLILVFGRCCRSMFLLKKLFFCIGLVVWGEWERNRIIFQERKHGHV